MMAMKKVVYADFSLKCQNYGNHIIEFATQKMLKGKYEEVLRFDSFYYHENGNINDTLSKVEHDFILIPGCTMYTNGQNKTLNTIDSKFEIQGFAGSIWGNNFYDKKKNYFGKVLNTKHNAKADLGIVKKLSGVVGCRDTFTYKQLLKNNINARYVGCPTLFLDESDLVFNNHNDDYCLFSFSRENVREQVSVAKELAKKYRIVGICHEVKDYNIIKSLGWNFPLVDYEGDVQKYLSYFLNAAFVVTGRLHGLLPSIAFNKKVIYFGNDDSRTTILDDILVEKIKLKDVCSQSPKLINKDIIYDIFFESMQTQIKEMFDI
ncbi:polysaccharide pyruvyl transferase family protein [Acinetobacter haemolyticus]|uniref:Polysaccharide pyruvyl transferase family protein n=1 Tax=Acinetobacter haemolyticus TaxID=29430 RepID=A0A857INU0_ACIHA|nr:polysaccharide pyruvyl transferase family protein [Acinetobacter haemolyticus]QHI11604.1 polysaccharide pyruvyl transferase family protein [Acinetobacter haemolyticus]QHI14871.1 polysaccharide pyruvyl transferase family protein [Acinetobacter haemolyticus]